MNEISEGDPVSWLGLNGERYYGTVVLVSPDSQEYTVQCPFIGERKISATRVRCG